MIVIDYQICCSAQNFIKIGSRFGLETTITPKCSMRGC